MGNLSKNFSTKELACPCCGNFIKVPRLIDALQKLRDYLGMEIHVNSSTRCEKHNLEVGGQPKSRHLYGEAADIYVDGLTPKELAIAAETIPDFKNGGIGTYPTFVHVDVRNHRARWKG